MQSKELMKQKVGNVAWPSYKYQLLSFRYDGETKVFIYVSKMLEFQDKQNETHLDKLFALKTQILIKMDIKKNHGLNEKALSL